MNWIVQGLFLLILGWALEAAKPQLRDAIMPLVFDLEPLPPIYSLNRRLRTGFQGDRRQPDPDPARHRASDDICPWPRLLA